LGCSISIRMSWEDTLLCAAWFCSSSFFWTGVRIHWFRILRSPIQYINLEAIQKNLKKQYANGVMGNV
jgi:hypothetical protein